MVDGISVVIPNYNGVGLLSQTLDATRNALLNTGLPFEIIVSDDYSVDNSVCWLKENHPDIKILENRENRGFAVTVNKGVATSGFSKVLLLNSDVKLTPGYFTNQLKYFDKDDTFGVMGRIVGWEDNVIQEGAKYPAFHGLKIKTSGNYILADEDQMKDGLFTMYLCGANAFIDKDKFLLLGGFNEFFSPFYIEDYDLSLRAWRVGFKCYFDYNSICRHKSSVTIKSKNSKRFISTIYDRNKFILHAIHLESTRKLGWFLQLLPESMIRLFTLRWTYFLSLYLFFRSFSKINESITTFNQLADSTGCKKSVHEVASVIIASVDSRKKIYWHN
jgi:GT2 family glycosyltransferase